MPSEKQPTLKPRTSIPRSPAARLGASKQAFFAGYSDQALLELRLNQLELRLEESWVQGPISQVQEELLARDLRLRPHFWLSSEWFSPSGVPGVAIPFYLAHPRLMRLERKMMLEVEGGNRRWCARLLRHELGHAMQHGFLLHRRRKWQQLFGPSSKPYPDAYRPKRSSKNYVLHLYQWYAQAHPDEDFAETFAVWLTPGLRWQSRYAGWPALQKLEYVDTLMQELQGRAKLQRSSAKIEPLSKLSMTLREFYAERQARYGRGAPSFFDRDLLRLFSEEERHRGQLRAATFLRKHKRQIRQRVYRWTGENQFTLEQTLREMITRSQALSLHLRLSPEETLNDFAILLTARTLHALYARRDRALL